MKKSLNLIILFLLIALIGGLFWYQNTKKETDEVHYHAGFIVYKDGKRQDFSALKYMHIQPCSDDKISHQENEQEERRSPCPSKWCSLERSFSKYKLSI